MLANRPSADEKADIVASVLAWLDTAGYADAFTDARANHARGLDLYIAARNAASDPDAVLHAMGVALLDGDMDGSDSAAALADAVSRSPENAAKVAATAVAIARTRAWAGLQGPGIVTDYLRPYIESLVERAEKLRTVLPSGIANDSDAIQAGAKAAAAWAALTEVATMLKDAQDALQLVTESGLVEHLPWSNDLSFTEVAYVTPVLPESVRRASHSAPHPVVALLHDLDHRQPTAQTISEAIEARRSRDKVQTLRDDVQLLSLVDGKPVDVGSMQRTH